MKKLLALVLTTVLCLCTLESCGVLEFHSISYQDADAERLLMDGYAPKRAKPGDTVVLRTGPIMDADLDFYANGVKLENTHNDSDYWEYTFIMPDEDVVITHDIIGGFGPKECVNHVDENKDGICDECGHEHTITYISADEAGHFENYTCGCPHDHGAVPHYDENGDYICDACGYVMPEHEHTGEWHTSESTHYYQYTCGCPSPDIAELHSDYDENFICDICEYVMNGHEHSYEYNHDDIGHGWSYTCGCMTPPNFAQHFDGNGDGKCDEDSCGYVICGTATNTGKVQTTIGEEASLPQFMSLEADKNNALSSGGSINVDVYMGYIILNKDGAAFSDIIVPVSDFAEYTFILEINYNNETRTVALDSLNYFEEYRCDMYQDVVQYSKYNTVQLDTTKMTGKSYGFVNVELYMISNTNERYYVSAETLYYSVTDTEIVFGLVSNPVATEGDPGIITKGWEYSN